MFTFKFVKIFTFIFKINVLAGVDEPTSSTREKQTPNSSRSPDLKYELSVRLDLYSVCLESVGLESVGIESVWFRSTRRFDFAFYKILEPFKTEAGMFKSTFL